MEERGNSLRSFVRQRTLPIRDWRRIIFRSRWREGSNKDS
jgi:hypothetical protein